MPGTTVANSGTSVPACSSLVDCVGLCRHVYRSHLLGLAGSFSQGQLADLKRCLPNDCVDYVEEDVKVLLLLMPLVSLTAKLPAKLCMHLLCNASNQLDRDLDLAGELALNWLSLL